MNDGRRGQNVTVVPKCVTI